MRSNVSPARVLRWIPRLLLIAAVTLVFIYPFWWMMVNSLNTNAQVFGPPRLLPQSWRWQNYVEIFQKQPFARHYANTLLVAGVGTLGNVLISALSGYGFARVRFPGRGILFILLLTALMMPVASSVGILAFLATWNMYLEPLVFTTSIDKYTLPLSLNNFNDVYGQPEWHLQLAATTLSVIPVMLVYLFFQEKVTDAMVNSGLKG